MTDEPVSRRTLLAMAGAAAALPLSAKARAEALDRIPAPVKVVATTPETVGLSLIAPLAPGSPLGAWTIARVLPLSEGAVSLVLEDANGTAFQIDVCARDAAPDARRGPAQTEKFELFLANRGDGALDTHEDHGLAAMALAEVIRANESSLTSQGFWTVAQRMASARVHID